MDDTKRAAYAHQQQEIPLLIRMNGPNAIGLFEEWKNIERSLPSREQMEKIYQTYTLYTNLPPTEFGLYYMAYVYDATKDLQSMDESAQSTSSFRKLIRDGTYADKLLPFLKSKTAYFTEKQVVMLDSSPSSSMEFWERLRDQRTRFLEKDKRIVELVTKWNDTIINQPVLSESCIIITDLFEEIDYQPSTDLWGMFDAAQLSPLLPMATYSSFYKMIDTFPVKKEWSTSSHQYITVYYQSDNSEKHTHCIYMYPENVIVQSKFQATGETPEDVIEHINRTFSIQLQRQEKNQKRIQAICYLDAPAISISQFLYFIYQDPVYSQFLFAEESRAAIKDKNFMYCYYYPNPRDTTTYITFTIRNVFKEEPIPCTIPHKMYPTNIRIKIRHCSMYRDIVGTLHMISQLLARYVAWLPTLETIFRRARVPLDVIREPLSKRSIKSKNPALVVGSIRGQEHLPTQVSIDDMKGNETKYYHINMGSEPYTWETPEKKNEEEGVDADGKIYKKPHVMIFPKNKEEEQFFYVCDADKKYPYVNLKKFKDDDSMNVYAPSCFKKIPKDKNNITLYETGEEEADEKIGSRPIKTGKTLKVTQLGLVQPWMERWYQLHDTTTQLLRRGVSISQLDSVLYALECTTTKDVRIPDETRIATKKKELVALLRSSEKYTNEVMTEAYGMSREELIHQFEFGYIDPMIYHAFLCRCYKMNIVLFTKKGLKNKDYFYLSLPRYHMIPIRTNPYPHTIGIVLNQGNEFNPYKFPLCETLLIQPIVTSIPPAALTVDQVKWDSTSDWVRYLYTTEADMYGTQQHNPLPLDTIISQTINESGLVSWFHTTKGSIQCKTPCHSQLLPCSTQSITCWTETDLRELIQRGIISPDIHNESYSNYTGYRLHHQGMDYFFPLTEQVSTTLHQYRLFEKTARYVLEYVYYGFSKYLHTMLEQPDEKEEHPPSREEIDETIINHMITFSSQFFTILSIEEIDYIQWSDNIKRELIEYNRFYDGTTLRISSEFIKKKLMYNLLNEYHTKKESLLRYHSEKKMRHFYVYPWDCISYPHHYIVTNEADYLTYAKHRTDTIDHASTIVRPYQTSPYIVYVQQELLGCKKWLMQPVSSVEEALLRFAHWKENRVNVLLEQEEWEGDDVSFHQVIWKNETEYDFYPIELNGADLDDNTEEKDCGAIRCYTQTKQLQTEDSRISITMLSIIPIEEDKSIIQVMLPLL